MSDLTSDRSAPTLVDMHCHLDFFADPLAFAHEADKQALGILGVSCTASDYLAHRDDLAVCPNIRFACGLHPWWIDQGRAGVDELERLLELIEKTRYVGEIGVDFSEKHVSSESFEQQVTIFRAIAETCASKTNKLLSVHAVKSAGTVLDILLETGVCNNCDVIFHWFSGSHVELWRAIDAGCYFSVNQMMLKTRRAPEYMKLIPAKQLLLETDYPPENPDEGFGASDIRKLLEETAQTLSSWLERDIAAETTANAMSLLQL